MNNWDNVEFTILFSKKIYSNGASHSLSKQLFLRKRPAIETWEIKTVTNTTGCIKTLYKVLFTSVF